MIGKGQREEVLKPDDFIKVGRSVEQAEEKKRPTTSALSRWEKNAPLAYERCKNTEV